MSEIRQAGAGATPSVPLRPRTTQPTPAEQLPAARLAAVDTVTAAVGEPIDLDGVAGMPADPITADLMAALAAAQGLEPPADDPPGPESRERTVARLGTPPEKLDPLLHKHAETFVGSVSGLAPTAAHAREQARRLQAEASPEARRALAPLGRVQAQLGEVERLLEGALAKENRGEALDNLNQAKSRARDALATVDRMLPQLERDPRLATEATELRKLRASLAQTVGKADQAQKSFDKFVVTDIMVKWLMATAMGEVMRALNKTIRR